MKYYYINSTLKKNFKCSKNLRLLNCLIFHLITFRQIVCRFIKLTDIESDGTKKQTRSAVGKKKYEALLGFGFTMKAFGDVCILCLNTQINKSTRNVNPIHVNKGNRGT